MAKKHEPMTAHPADEIEDLGDNLPGAGTEPHQEPSQEPQATLTQASAGEAPAPLSGERWELTRQGEAVSALHYSEEDGAAESLLFMSLERALDTSGLSRPGCSVTLDGQRV